MKSLLVLLLPLVSCANVSTTRFVFKDISGASLTVEMPKEMDAKKLIVEINAKNGTAKITADSIQTLNVETIKAQSKRESMTIESLSKGAAEGLIEGATKAIIP